MTRKWPDSPHWEMPASYLGADAHGHWLGVRRGALMQRPGMRTTAAEDHVCLIPHQGWWVATFYGAHSPARPFDVYVDVTTEPTWDGTEARAIDLDLDVIRTTEGMVYLDDEDEFAEHQRELGYPYDVVEEAENSAQWLMSAVENAETPFDEHTFAGWLARFRARLKTTP